MSFFRKRWVAWIVLILAIAAAVGLGQLRRPANRGYDKYIDDRAGTLNAGAEQTIRDCDARWDSAYGVRLAVLTLPVTPDRDLTDLGYAWGDEIGLSEWDMVLVLTADNWTVCVGDEIWTYFNDTYQTRMSAAINGAVDDNDAVSRFCTVMDDFCSHALRRTTASGSAAQRSAFPWGRLLLVVLAVAVIWIIVDRARYKRYRRRLSTMPVGAGGAYHNTPYYYPVFWGRRQITSPPRPPRPPRRPAGSTYRPASQKPVRPAKPSHPVTLQPGKTYRPNGKTSHGFGTSGGHSFGSSHSSFGGSRSSSGSRSSFSSSHSSSGRSSSGSRSISSSRSSSGHSFGGSRGGGKSFGGRR